MMALRTAHLPCRLAAHEGLFSIRDQTIPNVLNACRAFQRAWHIATQQGLSLQSFVGAPLYALPGSSEQAVPLALEKFLQTQWKSLLLLAEVPLILFRMGYASPPTVVTSRKPLECCWTPKGTTVLR